MAEHTEQEIWHTLEDGETLYCKTWKPSQASKARVVFVHGFSDHCNAYGPFFPALAARGIEVFAFDQRGWGRSVKNPKQKGLTGGAAQVLDDISSILSRFIPSTTENPDSIPLFLMGHSMGGAEVLHYTASPNPIHSNQHKHIRGVLLESPWISLDPATQPWKITVLLGRIASKILPHFQLKQQVNPNFLSRDQNVCDRLRDDALCHDTGTLEGLAGCLDRAAQLDEADIKVIDTNAKAIFMSHGTGDRVCAFAASQRWYDRGCSVEDRTFKPYEGWYHRLHEDIGVCAEQYVNDVVGWILERI